MELITIPAGIFLMGKGDATHQVYVETFQIGKYPVTAAQYQAFIDIADHASKKLA